VLLILTHGWIFHFILIYLKCARAIYEWNFSKKIKLIDMFDGIYVLFKLIINLYLNSNDNYDNCSTLETNLVIPGDSLFTKKIWK